MIVTTASVQAFYWSRSGLLGYLFSGSATAQEREDGRSWIRGALLAVPPEYRDRLVPIATHSVAAVPGWGLVPMVWTDEEGEEFPVTVQGDQFSSYELFLLPAAGEQCGRTSLSSEWMFANLGGDSWGVACTPLGAPYPDGPETHAQAVFERLPSWAFVQDAAARLDAEASASADAEVQNRIELAEARALGSI